MTKITFEKTKILDVQISAIDLSNLLDYCVNAVREKTKSILLGANIKSINLSYEIDWFRDFYNRSDLVFCDGVGIQLGAWLLGESIPERFTPPDWFPDLCQLCIEHDFSMFLLGTHPGVTEEVAHIYKYKYPGLKVSGTHHGYFDKEKESSENLAVVEMINQSTPDILIFGFGMPMQEKWLQENLNHLDAKVFIAVGAMFDFLAGKTYRGPRWLTDHGFEWMTRLATEPKRLWKRYLIGIPKFLWRIIKQKLGLNRKV